MPNYVTNIIYAKDVEALKKFTKKENGERVFDFNKIIPMPKDLNITSGSMSYIDNDFGFDKERHARQTKVIDPLLNKFYTPKITQNKFLSAVKKEWNKIKDNFKAVYNFKSSKFEEYDTIIKGIVGLLIIGELNGTQVALIYLTKVFSLILLGLALFPY